MKKRSVIISIILITLCVLYTIVVKEVNVSAIGPNESKVGLSCINDFFHDFIGVNKGFYTITNFMDIVLLLIPAIYGLIGLIELIKRKSLKKVDRELYILAIFYIVVVATYLAFEHITINYRPVLINKELDLSYPSSHTLAAICICGSSIIINFKLFKDKGIFKYITLLSTISMFIIIVGRLISGYHWFTDIIGGILIASTLLYIFNNLLSKE